jgi:cyanophycin synthetase
MFDHIIIRQDLRGRTEEEIINLILEGISSGQDVTYEIIPKKRKQIKQNCRGRKFITCLSDVVINAIEIVQEYLDRKHGII